MNSAPKVTHARYTPTYNPTRTTHPHACFAGPAPHLPWPLPRPFLSSLVGSSPRFGRRGWSRRGAGGPGGRRSETPREQRAEGARGRAARGRRLPGLVPRAPRARLPLPGSEEAGPEGEEGAGLWRLLWRRGRAGSETCHVLEAEEAGWIRVRPWSLLTGARRKKLWQ